MTQVSQQHMRWWGLLLACAAGCATPDGVPDEGDVAQPITTYVPQQGRLLLGFHDPDVRLFSFPTVNGVHVGAGGELITSAGGGLGVAGLGLVGSGDSGNVEMRIAQVIPPDGIHPWQYVLEQYDTVPTSPTVNTWIPACASPPLLTTPSEPLDDPPRAIAMPGYWTIDGLYVVSPTSVSFACRTGVAAKCDGWGYPVTATPPSITENGLPTLATGPDMMQACTRMARADYCASGNPNTLDGTPIRIDDIFTTVAPTPGYSFEAAWPGVAVVRRRIVRPPAICLSKLRWATLPLGGTCPLQVPDPRVDDKGTFCEDMTPAMLEEKGALLYSASAVLDAGLYTYTDPDTLLRLTTGKLLPQGVPAPSEWQIPKPLGVPFPTDPERVQFEATIFAPELPVDIPDTALVKIFSSKCDGDLVTAGGKPPSGCSEIAHEGWVYPPNTPDRAPLRRWYRADLKHSYTTVTSPTTMIANGWDLVEVIGGVLRAGLTVNVRWNALAHYSYQLDVLTHGGEWIPSCIDAAHIGATPKYAYAGICVGAANRRVDHADIASFRVRYTKNSQVIVATADYDGFSSDTYVDMPTGKATAVAVAWGDFGPGVSYTLDVRDGGDWTRCAGPRQLANETAYVHTGPCVVSGTTVPVPTVKQVRVCAVDPVSGTGHDCRQADYDGKAPRLEIASKKK